MPRLLRLRLLRLRLRLLRLMTADAPDNAVSE